MLFFQILTISGDCVMFDTFRVLSKLYLYFYFWHLYGAHSSKKLVSSHSTCRFNKKLACQSMFLDLFFNKTKLFAEWEGFLDSKKPLLLTAKWLYLVQIKQTAGEGSVFGWSLG